MADTPASFVALKSLRRGSADPATALADIRRIYFATTRETIDGDFAHAVELLMSLPSEDQRERATVFMEGLNEMRREWQKPAGAKPKGGRPRNAKNAPRAKGTPRR